MKRAETKTRECLRCDKKFQSWGKSNRICEYCIVVNLKVCNSGFGVSETVRKQIDETFSKRKFR